MANTGNVTSDSAMRALYPRGVTWYRASHTSAFRSAQISAPAWPWEWFLDCIQASAGAKARARCAHCGVDVKAFAANLEGSGQGRRHFFHGRLPGKRGDGVRGVDLESEERRDVRDGGGEIADARHSIPKHARTSSGTRGAARCTRRCRPERRGT